MECNEAQIKIKSIRFKFKFEQEYQVRIELWSVTDFIGKSTEKQNKLMITLIEHRETQTSLRAGWLKC